MIIGCYVLHVYCDSESELMRHHRTKGEYTGNDERTARAMAKADGWLLKRDGNAICKRCRARTGSEG